MSVITCPACGGDDVVVVEDGIGLCIVCVVEFVISHSTSQDGEKGSCVT